MFEVQTVEGLSKPDLYASLLSQAEGLLLDERDLVANAANFSALLYHGLPDVNWAGFYLWDGQELVVGPFQGRPACVRIAMGRGVCGAAAATGRTQVVADVDAFPGHIPCDSASRSEIVVPLHRPDGSLLGVLDIDSPQVARFDDEDRCGIEALAKAFLKAVAA
ncbi:MAG TPA: GAF domain-containing protein [Xanthomonadaceae bacterium]|nr:GAF domain-containing protein [Xanthomonadaceae bacterium]